MAEFTLDIKGKVYNTILPKSKALWPLFEAIVNSIQSIEDSPQLETATIEVFAQRQESGQIDFNGNIEITPFESFFITDNGEGFNQKNYKSFCTGESSLKLEKGCKGLGRFLWLKAFDKVRISSVFKEGGVWKKRQFAFNYEGTTDESLESTDSESPKTTVTLAGFKPVFQDECPVSLEVLSKKIIEHCLIYFLLDACPQIMVIDDLGNQFNLNNYFNQFIRPSLHQDRFSLDDRDFVLYHVKMPKGVDKHELHLCANRREVKSFLLKQYLPNLRAGRIYDDSTDGFYYAGFLTGAYLDSTVNNSRTNFDFEEHGQTDFDQSVPEKELIEAAKEHVAAYLKEYLDKIEESKAKRIIDYVQHQQPKYRYLIAQRPSTIEAISPNLSFQDLDIALHKELVQWDLELKKAGEELQRDVARKGVSLGDVRKRYEEYSRQVNGLSKTSLAEYIIRRKVILDLLENALQITADGTYASEESIHSIICPMQYTSDEVTFEEMNLWIIDERLAYHNFLASDKQMKSIPVINSDSGDRIDIAIFDQAISFSDKENQFNSITIIEFKKPNRNDLKPDDKNPIHQVLRYVEDIKSGKKMRANGRPFGNVANTAFYCYVIADMTDSLKQDAKFAGLRITPDGEGYSGIIPTQELM